MGSHENSVLSVLDIKCSIPFQFYDSQIDSDSCEMIVCLEMSLVNAKLKTEIQFS